MKINVLKRCESGDIVSLPAKDKAEANLLCSKLLTAPHVLGARLVAFAGGNAIINHVARFTPGEHEVPTEVGECLIGLNLAEQAK